MSAHPVVSHDEWVKARKSFLAREKGFTRERDALSRERRELPWEKVEKEYVFDGPHGKETLADLRLQLSTVIHMPWPNSVGHSRKHCVRIP
jgi:predicted dithiol-disulfide oxidoreductase (DUF899 family)